ncbi:MAG: sugar transferase, partial [Candidatus Eremiobacteraeota bacterium]|nr:sugar transferase [Candidatus Eremiobacteraeota bacterium]
RVGQHGRIFTMFKFRSMACGAEDACGPVWASAGDNRATKFGALLRRTSLDELPQLFNVLRGDMSVVGPRPERPFFVEMFRLMLPRYDERHRVKPGITGWSQVHMPRILDPASAGEKLAFDLFYIQHWSIFMDISVLCKTAVEFLFHKAA